MRSYNIAKGKRKIRHSRIMQIKDITNFLEQWAPLAYQASYDNSGLLLGEKSDSVEEALITLDVTEAVVDEAIDLGANLIIAHHPFIFKGIKKIGHTHWIDRCLRKCMIHNIAVYAIHTNLDHVHTGVNKRIADKIGLKNLAVLKASNDALTKLTFFVPPSSKETVLDAVYLAGAGTIGKYDRCSFQLKGTGTFRGSEVSNPSIGTPGVEEAVDETRVELLVPSPSVSTVLAALKAHHPYEEVAYYLQPLSNQNQEVGAGMVGELPEAVEALSFLESLKANMQLDTIRCTDLVKKHIKKVAICGGAGSFLLPYAKRTKADIFITADFKYHDFFEADGQIIVADIGHYESEVFTKDLLQERLREKFTNFAFHLSSVQTNPIKYL